MALFCPQLAIVRKDPLIGAVENCVVACIACQSQWSLNILIVNEH
jgi:hypothetical protein